VANLGVAGGRIADLANVTREERMLNMFPFAPHLAFWCMHYAGMNRNTFALSTGGGKCMGTEGNIKAILKLKPQVLVAMPTFVYHLLQQALDEHVRIEGVRLICLGGEKVPDGMRRKLSGLCEQLGSPGVRVIATYGFTEAKMASSTPSIASMGFASPRCAMPTPRAPAPPVRSTTFRSSPIMRRCCATRSATSSRSVRRRGCTRRRAFSPRGPAST